MTSADLLHQGSFATPSPGTANDTGSAIYTASQNINALVVVYGYSISTSPNMNVSCSGNQILNTGSQTVHGYVAIAYGVYSIKMTPGQSITISSTGSGLNGFTHVDYFIINNS